MYKYEHGGNIRFSAPGVLDFSANINPLGIPDGVVEAISDAIQTCNEYPDSFSLLLREQISGYEDIPVKNIICTNGASDLIFRIAKAVQPKKALLLEPTFSDYERALNCVDCSVCHYSLHEYNGFELTDEILSSLKQQRFDIVFICNPNNPTGSVISRKLMIDIMDTCNRADCFLVIDECFMDFVRNNESITIKQFVKKYKNVIVIKAFTKIFALAGVRLGYGICCNEQLLSKLYGYAPDWSVSTLAQAAGIAALKNADKYLKETLHFIDNEKARLRRSIEQLGYTIFSSKANYIFFKSHYPFDLRSELLNKHNICIRSCYNYRGLNECFYRIGVQNVELNDQFIYAIKEVSLRRR